MSIPNYLQKLKSAGIYRFVFDKSDIPGNAAETLRLVVGYSEKGPFNTPVYIEKATDFKTIYGDVSKKLERNGIFFHRLALQALKAGPILALNLKYFDEGEEGEKVQAYSFNADAQIGDSISLLIRQIYNTARFWTLEPEHLEDIIDLPNYIDIAATDSKETSCTIFMRGYHPTGYDVTLNTWYSSVLNGRELPEYMEGYEDTLASQYFAEVYVFRGKFTPALAKSEALAKYFDVVDDKVSLKSYIFDAFGNKIDTLEALSQNEASNFVNSYAGSLIPEFQASNGSMLAIDGMFNSDYDVHKMMMRLNQSLLYDGVIELKNLDTTGWYKGLPTTEGATVGDMMSATNIKPIVTEYTYNAETAEWEVENVDENANYYHFVFADASNIGDTLVTTDSLEGIIINQGDKFLGKDQQVSTVTDIIADGGRDAHPSVAKNAVEYANRAQYEYHGEIEMTSTLAEDKEVINTTYKSTLASYSNREALNDLARMLGSFYRGNANEYGVITYEDVDYTWLESLGLQGSNYVELNEDGTPKTWEDDPTKNKTLVSVITKEFLDGTYNPVTGASLTMTLKKGEDAIDLTVDMSVVEEVVAEVAWTDGTEDEYFSPIYPTTTLVFDKPLYTEDGTLYKCVSNITNTCETCVMVPTYVEGYTRSERLAKPQENSQLGKLNWINDAMLDALTKYEGLRIGLTNNVDVEYHYIVDTFDSYVESELKSKLSYIAKMKDNSILIANFPKMKTFEKCDYTSFVDRNGNFNTKYIAEGGNRQAPMAVVFGLPTEENGASWSAFYTQVIIQDPSTGVKYTCPSAALVSNCFMQKYQDRQPYGVVAGPDFSRLTENGLIGPDYNFCRQDLDYLEPFGVNCIVWAPRKGVYINGNQSAKQNPVTTLSSINVRECVIYIQDEIESILQSYQWWTNNAELRSKIKAKVDYLLGNVLNNGGIYDFNTVCDESNNTDEIIDRGMFIIDVAIEPARGAGIMVQQLTLYRKGGISSLTKQQ